MKNLLKNMGGAGGNRPAAPVQPALSLAAFGKHPGWDDHIPGVGLVTEGLAQLKQLFYVTGIGGQIDSGGWEKLEAGKRLDGFDHTFLWQLEGHLLLGRLWSSTDRKGRAKYPMIICVESAGISAGSLLAAAGPELEQLRSRCRSVSTSLEVEAACQDSQGRLRAGLTNSGLAGSSDPLSLEARRSFLENRQFGEGQAGLLRILHELEDVQGLPPKGRGAPAGGSAQGRSRHLRVPAVGANPDEILGLWLDFFRCASPRNMPVMLLLRAGVDWLDVVVGEPSGQEFFCLQASPLALPLSTLIPYELKPAIAARLQTVSAAFLASPSAPTAMGDTRIPQPESGAVETPGGGSPARKFPWIVVSCVAVVVLAGVGLLTRSRPAATPPETMPPVASASTTAPPVAVAEVTTPAATNAAPSPTPAEIAEQQRAAQAKADELARAQQEDERKAVLTKAQHRFDSGDYGFTNDPDFLAAASQPALAELQGQAMAAAAKQAAEIAAQAKTAADQALLAQAQGRFSSGDYGFTNDTKFLELTNQPAFLTLLGEAMDAAAKLAATQSAAQVAAAEKSAEQALLNKAQAQFNSGDFNFTNDAAFMALTNQAAFAALAGQAMDAATKLAAQAAAAAAAQADQVKTAAEQGLLAKEQGRYNSADYSYTNDPGFLALTNRPAFAALLGQTLDAAAKLAAEQAKVQQQESDYQAALQKAQAAFTAEDYDTVVAQARAALAVRSGDKAVQNLLDLGQQKQAEREKQRRDQEQIAKLLAAGQAALDQNNGYGALSNVAAVLALQQDNPAALVLNEKAQNAIKYQEAIQKGQAALKRGDHETALKQADMALTVNKMGAEALQLKAAAAQSSDADRAKAFLAAGNYAAAQALCDQHANDPVFAAVAASITQKEQQELQSIDDFLEADAVLLGVISADNAKSELARSKRVRAEAEELAPELGENRDSLSADVKKWEKRLTELHALDARAATINKLKKAIDDHP